MNKRQALPFLVFLSFLLSSSIACVYAQDEGGDGSDPLQPVWDAIYGLEDAVGSLWDAVTSFPSTIEGFISWLWGSITNFINWLWEQFYSLIIAPIVEGFKAAVSAVASSIRASIDWTVNVIAVQLPRWFIYVFGPIGPVVGALILGLIAVGMYLAVKLVITLL